jgi:hypothetical protein
MLNIGGELSFILKDIDYSSKKELMSKLKDYKKGLKGYTKEEKKVLVETLEISIQEARFLKEKELLNYKVFCERSNNGRRI